MDGVVVAADGAHRRLLLERRARQRDCSSNRIAAAPGSSNFELLDAGPSFASQLYIIEPGAEAGSEGATLLSAAAPGPCN